LIPLNVLSVNADGKNYLISIDGGVSKMVEKMVEIFTPEVIAITIAALAALTLLTFLMMLMNIVSLSRIKKRLFIIAEKSIALEEKQATFRQDAQMVNNTIANLAQTADKIGSIEHELDEFSQKIAESQNLLAGLESTLNGHESTLNGHESTLNGHESALNGHESTLKGLESTQKGLESILKEHESTLKEYESKQKEHDTLLGKAGQMMGKEAAGFTQVVQRIRILEDEFLSLKVFQRTFEITRNQILNVLVGMPINMPNYNMLPTEHRTFTEDPLASSDAKTSDADDGHNPRMNRY